MFLQLHYKQTVIANVQAKTKYIFTQKEQICYKKNNKKQQQQQKKKLFISSSQ